MRLVAHGGGLHVEPAQRSLLFLHLLAQLMLPHTQRRLLGFHSSRQGSTGRNLIQACPPHWVEPGAAYAAVTVVHRPGRRILARKGILCIETPETAIAAHPAGVLVDKTGSVPPPTWPGPSEAVATRIVNKRDGENTRGIGAEVMGVAGTGFKHLARRTTGGA